MQPLKIVLRFARNYKTALAVTVLSMILLVSVRLLIPWIIRLMIGAVTAPGAGPAVLDRLLLLSGVVLALYLVRAVLQFLRSYIAHIAGWGVVADARKHIYEHLQRLSLRFYEDKQTGQLMSRVVNDSDLFEKLIAHALPEIMVNVLTLVGVSAVLFLLNWQLALLSILPIPLVIMSLRLYAKYVRPAFRERQTELGNLNALLNDNLSGIREIKAFNREAAETHRIAASIDRYRRSLLAALRLMATFQPFVEFTSSLGVIVIIYFGGRLVLQQALPVADLVAFFLYLELLYQPVHHLSDAWEQIQESLAGADRVADLLTEQPEVATHAGAVDLPGRAEGALAFRDVSFSYTRDMPVLEGITLTIPAHSVVALVGPSGVGKSTLASLIPRFYDVTAGSIQLDGHDLRDLSLSSLRRQISMVLQDVFLFHGTVRENILFGRPDATEAEVVKAAELANAHEFVHALPAGYDTIIGERGVKLSGGQKQRIAIARALLKDAPILILDEATSSVDTATEVIIQEALERLMVGRTTIIIAHRLSTIRSADTIVVLQGNSIVEQGTHEQLVARGGVYKRLLDAQRHLEPLATGEPARPAAREDGRLAALQVGVSGAS
jgi:ATP-binding cassette subfamily B protein/subfamily B ATP-binding cassette protein MsbA